jgi:hypothetical protein
VSDKVEHGESEGMEVEGGFLPGWQCIIVSVFRISSILEEAKESGEEEGEGKKGYTDRIGVYMSARMD